MDQQRLALTCAFITVGLLTSANASAQSSAAPIRRDIPQAVPRTPDGRPDLQGTWTNPYTATPLERPAQLADKAFFTEREARDWETGAYQRLLKALPAPELTGELLWLDEWRVAENRRTSLIARWEGDTLVVDTTNVSPHTRFKESTERLHVVERFRRSDPQTLVYTFTVDDPHTWTQPWSAEILFKSTDERIFEFACHEANYSLANVLRGARVRDQSSRN